MFAYMFALIDQVRPSLAGGPRCPFTGYILTMAAGVRVGLAAWRARNDNSVRPWAGFRLPMAALADAGCLYLLAVPIFLVGSLWEFLA